MSSYDVLRQGLNAPICLTWEMTYACNLLCVHCLSSSGKRAPDELSTAEAKALLDEWAEMRARVTGMGGRLGVTRLRPSGGGREVWDALKLTQEQSRGLYAWLRGHPDVLTGDSFFHLSALGSPLDGLNMCGAGRIVCCVDPRGDVYACPFVLAEEFKAGNVRDASFASIWSESPLFDRLRGWEVGGQCRTCGAYGRCHGGCMAVKHFTGTPLDDPDPECVFAPESGPTTTIIPLTLSPRPIRAD